MSHAKITAANTRARLPFITRFGFYQRWFDTVFLLSGCASAVILFFLHLANRSSDADNRDDHHADGCPSLDSSHGFSSEFGVSNSGTQGAAVRVRPKGRVSVAGGMKPVYGTEVRSRNSYDRAWMTSRRKSPSKQS